MTQQLCDAVCTIAASPGKLFDFLPLNNREKAPTRPFFDDPGRIEASLDTLIPDNPNKPYDIHEVIRRVVDDGDFYEVHKDYAGNIVVGFAHLGGYSVGIVANQPAVLAAVVLYRLATFLVPIPIGLCTYLYWRRSTSWRRPPGSRGPSARPA